jgi:molecular chaperone DnaK
MVKIIGIDLGTTNSVAAAMEGANPKIIINAEGSRLTPSVVAYTTKKELLVGLMAKRQAVINPTNTFSSVKRFIGLKFDEVSSEINRVSYTVIADKNKRIKINCPILNKDFSPEEISAHILKKLKTDASTYLNTEISQAIITVPAYFNDSQRQATKDAGSIAGLEVLRILNEPTAAALIYGLKRDKNQIVLIFDLGGGTFDVSVLEVGPDMLEVLSTSGDTHLGGDDFDERITKYILDEFLKNNSIDLSTDKQALQRIIEASERAKIELSNLQSTIINLPFIHISPEGIKNIDMSLERSLFENLTKDLILKCKNPILKALNDAKLEEENIDEIILVGGSTRIPAVRNLLKDLFKKPLNETVNPDEVVAMGAAVQAGIIAGEITDLILLDVTPLSLGVETLNGIMTTMIQRNTSVPVKKSEIFSTSLDQQQSVDINVLQGEDKLAKNNRSLGVFTLAGIPAAPKGIPRINVTFQLDVNGLLSVYAKEEESNIEQSIKIEGSSVLSKEEIEKLSNK